jgi:hypothetical protein
LLLRKATEKRLDHASKYIQEHLSEAIDHAFDNLPTEAQDATIAKIKLNLKLRRAQLVKYASKYSSVLQKNLIVGTHKDDKFVINHVAKNKIEVSFIVLKTRAMN